MIIARKKYSPYFCRGEARATLPPSPTRLRLWCSSGLAVRYVVLCTVGGRVIPVSGAKIQNEMSPDVTSAPIGSQSSVSVWRHFCSAVHSRTYLFHVWHLMTCTTNVLFTPFLPRDAIRRSRNSSRQAVCPSVTLRSLHGIGYIGWNTSTIILWLIS